MMAEYKRSIDRLESLFSTLSKTVTDEYILALIAAHVCVLQSGILENILKEHFGLYAEGRSAPEITNFVKRRLHDLQNPRTERIEDLVGAFSRDWREGLCRFWDDSEIKGHINSIVANRNLISHGRPTSVTISQTKEWMVSIKRFADFVEQTFV